MKNFISALAASVAMLVCQPCYAANLKGTYSFVGHDSCTLTGAGVGSGVGTINGTAQGFAIFNGDGTGTITVKYDWVVTIHPG